MAEGDRIIPKEPKVKTVVVKELPMEPVREYTENGIKYKLVTTEEFLTELANQE